MKLSDMIREMQSLLKQGDCEVLVEWSDGERLPATVGEGADKAGRRAVLITLEA